MSCLVATDIRDGLRPHSPLYFRFCVRYRAWQGAAQLWSSAPNQFRPHVDIYSVKAIFTDTSIGSTIRKLTYALSA